MPTTLTPSLKTSGEIARSDTPEMLPPFGTTFGRLFDDFWAGRLLENGREMAPALDVIEDDKSIQVAIELPGLGKDDVKIQIENGLLTVSGEKKWESEEKGKVYHRVERRYGAFARSLTVPSSVNAEAATAETKDGVLTISLPKREEAKPKTIRIR